MSPPRTFLHNQPMTAPFRNVAIFAKPRTEGNRPALQQVLLHIVRLVEQAGLTAVIEADTRKAGYSRGFEGHTPTKLVLRARVTYLMLGDRRSRGCTRERSLAKTSC